MRCKHCKLDYLKEEHALQTPTTKLQIFKVLHTKVKKHIIYDTRLEGIHQKYMTYTEITQSSCTEILNLMKIDTHETKGYYYTDHDKHFQL